MGLGAGESQKASDALQKAWEWHMSPGVSGAPALFPGGPAFQKPSVEPGLLHHHPRHPGCRGHSDTQVAVRAGAGQHHSVPRTLAGLNLTCNCSSWRLPEPRSPLRSNQRPGFGPSLGLQPPDTDPLRRVLGPPPDPLGPWLSHL